MAFDTGYQNVPKGMNSFSAALNATVLANANAKPSNVLAAENQLLAAYSLVKSLTHIVCKIPTVCNKVIV